MATDIEIRATEVEHGVSFIDWKDNMLGVLHRSGLVKAREKFVACKRYGRIADDFVAGDLPETSAERVLAKTKMDG